MRLKRARLGPEAGDLRGERAGARGGHAVGHRQEPHVGGHRCCRERGQQVRQGLVGHQEPGGGERSRPGGRRAALDEVREPGPQRVVGVGDLVGPDDDRRELRHQRAPDHDLVARLEPERLGGGDAHADLDVTLQVGHRLPLGRQDVGQGLGGAAVDPAHGRCAVGRQHVPEPSCRHPGGDLRGPRGDHGRDRRLREVGAQRGRQPVDDRRDVAALVVGRAGGTHPGHGRDRPVDADDHVRRGGLMDDVARPVVSHCHDEARREQADEHEGRRERAGEHQQAASVAARRRATRGPAATVVRTLVVRLIPRPPVAAGHRTPGAAACAS